MPKTKIDKFVNEHMKDSSMEFVKPTVKNRPSKRWLKLTPLIIGVVVVVGAGVWLFITYRDKTSADQQAENKALIAKVYKLIDLPQNETPTIATVSDKSGLKNQDFFSTAENGDKILIYAGFKMAILYRPSVNKIIKVAPLVMDTNTNTNSATNSNAQAGTNSNTNSVVPGQ